MVIKLVTEKIRLISVELVPLKLYSHAESLTKGIDIDDTEFVALAMFINGKLWTGDKKLFNGLSKKHWNEFITTEELLSF